MPPVVGGEHRAGIGCPHCAATMNVSTIEKIQPPVVMRFAGASVALTPSVLRLEVPRAGVSATRGGCW